MFHFHLLPIITRDADAHKNVLSFWNMHYFQKIFTYSTKKQDTIEQRMV